jgi:hypothetical protein
MSTATNIFKAAIPIKLKGYDLHMNKCNAYTINFITCIFCFLNNLNNQTKFRIDNFALKNVAMLCTIENEYLQSI